MEPLQSRLHQASPAQIDFLNVGFISLSSLPLLQACFNMSPEKRWSCAELLQHEYFKGWILKIKSEEPTITTPTLKKVCSRDIGNKQNFSES